jgi:hypothetical protein
LRRYWLRGRVPGRGCRPGRGARLASRAEGHPEPAAGWIHAPGCGTLSRHPDRRGDTEGRRGLLARGFFGEGFGLGGRPGDWLRREGLRGAGPRPSAARGCRIRSGREPCPQEVQEHPFRAGREMQRLHRGVQGFETVGPDLGEQPGHRVRGEAGGAAQRPHPHAAGMLAHDLMHRPVRNVAPEQGAPPGKREALAAGPAVQEGPVPVPPVESPRGHVAHAGHAVVAAFGVGAGDAVDLCHGQLRSAGPGRGRRVRGVGWRR